MAESNPLTGLYNDFVTIVNECVIKYNKKARIYETTEMTKAGDQYISALYKEDNFFSYMTYDRHFLIQVGITDEQLITKYMENRRNIPDIYHEQLLLLKRKDVVDTYVEKNNYYRMLNGLPNIEDTNTDFVYILSNKYGTFPSIDEITPIHLLEDYQIVILKESGVLTKIIEEYPDKEYLKHLGSNRIPIDISRKAKNFELIKMPTLNISDVTRSNFPLIYEQCRYYFMNVIYVQEYVDIMDYYDEFIAMCIMVMCINQSMSRSIEIVINRDFFDEQLIRLLYESYKMPYISELPFDIQKDIARNLNMLIQYKSTDKVLYDIAALLGYDSVSIYKYYLIKEQRFAEDGDPISATRIVLNDEGEYVEEPDYEAMYNVYFRQIELTERDYFKAMQNQTTVAGYHEIVDPDPYWWEDDDLYKLMYESEYNYVETKYLGMNISYKLSEIMFETVYLIRMLFDKKDELTAINLELPRIYDENTVNIFDCVVLLCAITCKKNNLKGEILMSQSKILHVLGFNFKHDFDLIRSKIHDDPLLDNEMLKYLNDMTAYTPESVNNLYKNIKKLEDYISEKMAYTNDIDEYNAYYLLYKALYIQEENATMFDISGYTPNKQYPDTYMEYIQYTSPHLYDIIKDADADTLTSYAEHIISRLNLIIEDIRYLYLLNDMNNDMLEALIKLIRFFKSYTCDMINLNVVYIFDTKALNMLKLIDKIEAIEKEVSLSENLRLAHSDFIDYIKADIFYDEKFILTDEYKIISTLFLEDYLHLWDDIHLTSHLGNMNDYLRLYDTLDIDKYLSVNSGTEFYDRISITMLTHLYDKLELRDEIRISSDYTIQENMKLFEVIGNIDKTLYMPDSLTYSDRASVTAIHEFYDTALFSDNATIVANYTFSENMGWFESVDTISKTIHISDNLSLGDKISNKQ